MDNDQISAELPPAERYTLRRYTAHSREIRKLSDDAEEWIYYEQNGVFFFVEF
jgi:hypothetical protein